jgi:hypothetical protein
MKKLLLVAAVAASVVLSGCAKCNSCASKNAKFIKGNPPINNSRVTHCDYCDVIGVKLADPDVVAGKEKTFPDGVVIRNLDPKQIVKDTPAPAPK